jgi:hypothetical protein
VRRRHHPRCGNDLGYNVTVIHDACASRDLEFNGSPFRPLTYMLRSCQRWRFAYASVVSTNEFLVR